MPGWAHDYFERGYLERWPLGPPTERTQREVSVLWEHLQLADGARLLDVGCGHGRHALAFAQRGATAIGLDFSTHLLDRARELAAALDVAVSWIRGDMRALPVRERSVQAVTLFDAFGFFDTDAEDARVLGEIARVLSPGGGLALKVANAVPIIAGFRRTDGEEREGASIEIERTLLTDPARLVEDVVVRGPRGSGRYQRRQRLYHMNEVTAAMEAVGFTAAPALDANSFAEFEATTSGSMLIVAAIR